MILHDAKTFQVERNGKDTVVNIPEDFSSKLIKFRAVGFITARMPFVRIDSVIKNGAADSAGLRKGDKILTANGKPTEYFHEFRSVVVKNPEKQISLQVLRGTDTVPVNLTVPKKGAIGIENIEADSVFQYKTTRYGLFEAIPAGLKKSRETLEEYWLQLKLIFSGKVNPNESLGSVVSIGKMFPSKWNWQAFWQLTAFFSLVLALMNILPIPALDGGHALFTIIEMITGRKPNEKVVEYAQMAGMILLLGLMAYALGLDIFRIFK